MRTRGLQRRSLWSAGVLTGALLAAALPLGGDEIDDYMRARMRDLHLPGVAIAIVREGQVITTRTYGKASLELDVPVSEATVFEIGSLTKQFTAAAISLLADEGKVRLDDSISTYLPELPEAWHDITVRHLLTHSSGIQEYLSIPGLADEAHGSPHRDMTLLFAERLKREFAAGQTWAYSNSGYLLLGDIIERVSGRSYWDFLRERIFDPLGMTATRSSEPRAVIPNRASGYGWRDGSFENRPALSENAYSAGSIASTIRDLSRWEAALHRRKLLSRKSFAQMWTPLTVSSGSIPPFSYGFGWVIDSERGHRAVFHSGGTPGFSSAIRRYPDDGMTVIVLANHGDRILDHVPLEIAEIVFPAVKRKKAAADPDPARTAAIERTFRSLIGGTHDPGEFTPAMQLFLRTATGRGLWEWIASHGELQSMTYVQTERATDRSTQRYRAVIGDAQLWFSVTLTDDGRIAQIYWW